MRKWLLISLLALSFPTLGQDQYWKDVPIENAYQKDPNLKKVVDALNDKLWTISKLCFDDTCTERHKRIDSFYCFFSSWGGTMQGEDVFISASLNDVGYVEDIVEEEPTMRFFSCAPIIAVKKQKKGERSVYVIEHMSNSGRHIMELTLLDDGGFTISGPALYTDKKTQLTEYRIAKPTKDALEKIKEWYKRDFSK